MSVFKSDYTPRLALRLQARRLERLAMRLFHLQLLIRSSRGK